MSNRFSFQAETRLIRWGESSSAGRTITLEIPPDDGAAHPFRGFPTGHTHGQRFRMQFDAIGDDEQLAPPNSPAGTQPSTERTETVIPPGKDTRQTPAGETQKERRPWHTLKPQEQAALVGQEPRFWKWANSKSGVLVNGADDAADFIRWWCKIPSRRDLETSGLARQAFYELMSEYRMASGLELESR